MKRRHAIALFVAIMLTGCAARPMVCIPIRVGSEPALGCVDASTVDGRITPYESTTEIAPDPPRPGLVPWRDKHGDTL